MNAVKIIGITRYSVISRISFLATRGMSEADARAKIWQENRMAHRAKLFNAIALPSFGEIARIYPDYTHIVLISQDLPAMFKGPLQQIASTRPWLKLVEVDDKGDFSALNPVLRDIVGDATAYVFRIDDDDALSPQAFVDTVLANANCAPGTAMSLDEGYMIRPAWNSVSIRKETIPFVSAGLGVFTTGPQPLSIYALGNQNKFTKKGIPTIYAKGRLWLRSKTDTSDTPMSAWKRWRFFPTPAAELEQCLRRHFPGLETEAVIDAITDRAG
jgi:Putative rhamnosyl transferase